MLLHWLEKSRKVVRTKNTYRQKNSTQSLSDFCSSLVQDLKSKVELTLTHLAIFESHLGSEMASPATCWSDSVRRVRHRVSERCIFEGCLEIEDDVRSTAGRWYDG